MNGCGFDKKLDASNAATFDALIGALEQTAGAVHGVGGSARQHASGVQDDVGLGPDGGEVRRRREDGGGPPSVAAA